MWVPRAMYSLRMSFWTVPPIADQGTPCSSATVRYMDSRIEAVELIVIEVVTRSSGIPSNRVLMSSMLSIATPTRPTSPRAGAASES